MHQLPSHFQSQTSIVPLKRVLLVTVLLLVLLKSFQFLFEGMYYFLFTLYLSVCVVLNIIHLLLPHLPVYKPQIAWVDYFYSQCILKKWDLPYINLNMDAWVVFANHKSILFIYNDLSCKKFNYMLRSFSMYLSPLFLFLLNTLYY